MKVLYVSAEADPFAKVGGLGDVAAALPACLRETGHQVRVVTPCHASAMDAFEAAPGRRTFSLDDCGTEREVEVAEVTGEGGVPVQLVLERHYFGREAVYGAPDDLLRYEFFCRAVARLLGEDGWTPDILHLNDWHTAPLAYALGNMAWSDARFRGIASVLTVHNLRYRGPDAFNDLLAQGIYYSDIVTTVSPSYAREILTPALGEGLDGLLGLRSDHLRGILNGLSYGLYDPGSDPHLAARFGVNSLAEREAGRQALRTELGFPGAGGPVLGMVTRLTEQKGIDLVLHALPAMLAAGAQLVVLGQGDANLVEGLRAFERSNPGSVRLAERFDEGLARRIYGGADMLLMPSRYEPCGLGQLIAMRYGCVPVGRRTGGLADTILDPDEHPDAATGFLFDDFTPHALTAAFERATRAFHSEATWRKLQENGMSRDFSWSASALHYVAAYEDALRARGIIPHA